MNATWRVVLFPILVAGCAPQPMQVKKDAPGAAIGSRGTEEVEAELRRFIDGTVPRLAVLQKELNLAQWAATTGDPAAYPRISQKEIEIRKLLSDQPAFAYLKKTRSEGRVQDPLLKRQLEILYLDHQENQIEPALMERMVQLSTEIREAFNGFRGTVAGEQVTDNDIHDILKSVRNSSRRKEAWEAYKKRGAIVRDRILELVRLRNRAAIRLGYPNFYEMRLRLIEQDPAVIKQIFDDLAAQTDKPFHDLMQEINRVLAERYRIKVRDLRPWHYEDPFFQEAPTLGKLDLDSWFEGQDPRILVNRFFKGVGLDPADILERSDLYEKEGKMPSAYCIDMDREGDVRILANLRPSEKWTSVLLHEMGHAVYDKHLDPALPWLLREPAHSFTTEAVAELFARLTRNPLWLQSNLGLRPKQLDSSAAQTIRSGLRTSMLVMARWTMVMVHFERELYTNPDQDLDKLWWDLKKRYQLLNPPDRLNAPDWASKIHIAAYPVYYHNYMLGELMASQILHHVSTKIVEQDLERIDLTGRKELGRFLKEKIFKPGKRLHWDELLRQATGESLNPKYFADEFVR